MSAPPEKLAEGTLISHLLELRERLVRATVAVFIVFIPAAIYRNQIFEHLAQPLLAQLPAGSAPIATGVMSPFITPFKLAFFFSLFIAMPFVLYQIWAFVAPGLYRREKRFAVPLLISSIVLFYVGTAFAYRFVFPMAFHFFVASAPKNIMVAPDINNYLEFALTTFFAFGLAFEIPVIVVLLTLTGLVSVQKLAHARGYVIIGIFVAAAVLTPPDPLSQILMAIPMWLLYEGGLILARLLNRPRDAARETGADA
ncbi:MAG: twin-arginine translocase subunit TatC [Steroidobacteraceae bacterium]